jgi:hypothetical protein
MKQRDIPGAYLGCDIVHEVTDHLDVVTRHYLTKISIAHQCEGG